MMYLLTADRFVCAIDPLKYNVRMTRRLLNITIAVLWTLSFMCNVFPRKNAFFSTRYSALKCISINCMKCKDVDSNDTYLIFLHKDGFSILLRIPFEKCELWCVYSSSDCWISCGCCNLYHAGETLQRDYSGIVHNTEERNTSKILMGLPEKCSNSCIEDSLRFIFLKHIVNTDNTDSCK